MQNLKKNSSRILLHDKEHLYTKKLPSEDTPYIALYARSTFAITPGQHLFFPEVWHELH